MAKITLFRIFKVPRIYFDEKFSFAQPSCICFSFFSQALPGVYDPPLWCRKGDLFWLSIVTSSNRSPMGSSQYPVEKDEWSPQSGAGNGFIQFPKKQQSSVLISSIKISRSTRNRVFLEKLVGTRVEGVKSFWWSGCCFAITVASQEIETKRIQSNTIIFRKFGKTPETPFSWRFGLSKETNPTTGQNANRWSMWRGRSGFCS